MSVKNVFNAFQTFLLRRPMVSNSMTTAAIIGAGDVLAQTTIERDKKYDAARTARMALFGAVLGPIITKWYMVLEKKVGASSSYKIIAMKIIADQTLFAPICNAFCIASISLLDGKNPRTELNTNYKDILIANYKLWPFVQVINFTAVPLHLRTVFVQLVAVGWNTYVMWKLHRSEEIRG